jgi:hypothetical protein
MNRIYYAAFYAASAALLERRASFKKHTGVRAAFHREFIRSGALDTKWGKFYDQLFEDRQEGDYVETQLARSREFLNVLRPLVIALGGR